MPQLQAVSSLLEVLTFLYWLCRARRQVEDRRGKDQVIEPLGDNEPHMGRTGLTPGCLTLARIQDALAVYISVRLARGQFPGVHFELSGSDAPVRVPYCIVNSRI